MVLKQESGPVAIMCHEDPRRAVDLVLEGITDAANSESIEEPLTESDLSFLM